MGSSLGMVDTAVPSPNCYTVKCLSSFVALFVHIGDQSNPFQRPTLWISLIPIWYMQAIILNPWNPGQGSFDAMDSCHHHQLCFIQRIGFALNYIHNTNALIHIPQNDWESQNWSLVQISWARANDQAMNAISLFSRVISVKPTQTHY